MLGKFVCGNMEKCGSHEAVMGGRVVLGVIIAKVR